MRGSYPIALLVLVGCSRVGFDLHELGVGRTGDSESGFASGDGRRGDPVVGDPRPGDAGDPGAGDPMGDPGAGDPGAGDPGAGDPGAGDPGAGDPGAGDPGAGDPGAGDPGAGDASPWTGPPATPTGVVLDECSSGLCFTGENIGLRWDPTPGATYYEVRWTCSITQEIAGPLTETDYADALDYPIGLAWTCGFITDNYEVCACNGEGCTCTDIPPPVPNTCGGGACNW